MPACADDDSCFPCPKCFRLHFLSFWISSSHSLNSDTVFQIFLSVARRINSINSIHCSMQKQNILHSEYLRFGNGSSAFPRWIWRSNGIVRLSFLRAEASSSSSSSSSSMSINKISCTLQHGTAKSLGQEIQAGLSEENEEEEEEEDLCPVECVTEFKTDDELVRVLEKAKETNSLVVVDFYRPSCGSCKYIEQGFSKLCKQSGDQEAPVIFLKHNVIDEYDEQSEVAEKLRIKSVPLFHFYKNGLLLEAFATRDKERIDAAILKYTSSESD